MEIFLINSIHFEAPATPITPMVFFKVAAMLVKEFPVISSMMGLLYLVLIVQFFRIKVFKCREQRTKPTK